MEIRLRDQSVGTISVGTAVETVRGADYVRWYDALPGGPVDQLEVSDLAFPAFLDGVPNFKQLLNDSGWGKLSSTLRRASGALRLVPAYTGLDTWEATEDHAALLKELFMACSGGGNDSLSGFGPARCTKMLHKKRPALIPIVDSWQLQAWGKRTDPWSTADMVEVVFAIKGFMAAQMPEFADLAERLRRADPSLPQLSAIRLYDILFWEMSRATGVLADTEATE